MICKTSQTSSLGQELGDLGVELPEAAVGLHVLPLVDLDVALRERHHLWQHRRDAQVVDLEPLRGGLMKDLPQGARV